MAERVWDIGLGKTGRTGELLCAYLPAALSRSLIAGLFRAELTVTDKGILIQPYVAEAGKAIPKGETVELPAGWGKN